MLNIPQENRQILAVSTLININNYLDDDVIHDAQVQIEQSDNMVDLVAAIAYAISAVEYRGKMDTSDYLKSLSQEIASYGSLYQAIENKNQQAIGWWESQANDGQVVRIV